MYQRSGETAIKKDLTNILSLCEHLGDPHKKVRYIHIAGTNGKGSVSHMLSAIYQASGMRVGLYTSPHYLDFRERIKIDGSCISHGQVVKFCERILPVVEEIRPSFFEITVAMAFDYFAQQRVDLAIVETGLGGRLDSTNVVIPILSVITNIGLDHKNILGNTLSKIAAEKAGIIKAGVPVMIGERQERIQHVFEAVARDLLAPISFADEWIAIRSFEETDSGLQIVIESKPELDYPGTVQLNVHGDYQLRNLMTTMASVALLTSTGQIIVSTDSILQGLANIQSLTNLQGRWQILQKRPCVVVDSGHNAAGLRLSMKQLNRGDFLTVRMIVGFVKEKDVHEMIDLMPPDAIYYWCAAKIPRAMSSEEVAGIGAELGRVGRAWHSVEKAVEEALSDACPRDLVFVGGSTFVVAEALALF